MFIDVTTGRPLDIQAHLPSIKESPYLAISIYNEIPQHWIFYNWSIIYSIFQSPMPYYEFTYYEMGPNYTLVHRLPDHVDLEDGAWRMLPTFRVRLEPVPPVLTGTVTCDDTGRPIPGVTINLYDDNGYIIEYRITDENGFFDFGEVPIGNLEVGMDHSTIPYGYEILETSRYNRQLTTSPGGVYEEHFRIRPVPEPPTLTKAIAYVNGEAHTGEAVDVGDVITYVLTVYNPNRRIIEDFLVVDELPVCLALDVASVQVNPGNALSENQSAGNTVSVILNLPPGNTTITFDAVVTTYAYDKIVNLSRLYGPPGDNGREEVDRDDEEVPVVDIILPTITKVATYLNGEAYDGEPVDVGDVITYVLTVNNPNRRTLEDFLVVDQLPMDLALNLASIVVDPDTALVDNQSAGNTVQVVLNLPPGDTTITYAAIVMATAEDNIINIAVLYGPPGDNGREEVDEDDEEVPVVDIVPPTLIKDVAYVNDVAYTGEEVSEGDVITYVITVNNPNRRVLENYRVVDALPNCLALNVDSVLVDPNRALVENNTAGNTVDVILNLPPGDTTITFTAVVTDEAEDCIKNVAVLYGPDGPVDDDEVTVDVEEPVILTPPTITKSADEDDPVRVGDTIAYTLVVNNPNAETLYNHLVVDALPACLALNVASVAVDPSTALVDNQTAGNTVAVVLDLPPGDTIITFTAVVTEVAGDSIINIAVIYSPPTDGDYRWCAEEDDYVYSPGGREEVDRDNEEVPVIRDPEAPIPPTITKSADQDYPVRVGDTIAYTLVVNNPNAETLYNHLVVDALPACLALNVASVAVDPSTALVYNQSAGNTVAVVLNLPPGNTTITFTAVATEVAEDYIINVAYIYSPPTEGDYNWCDVEEGYVYSPGGRDKVDRDDEEVPVIEDPPFPPSITKTAKYEGDAVEPGDEITYVLTVNNPNASVLENFTVVDALPAGLSLNIGSVVVNPSEALVSNQTAGNTVRVVLNLPPGNTTITFTATVTDEAKYYIRNIAYLYGPDGVVDNDDAKVDIVPPRAPTTGDALNMLLWVILAGLGFFVIAARTVLLKRAAIREKRVKEMEEHIISRIMGE